MGRQDPRQRRPLGKASLSARMTTYVLDCDNDHKRPERQQQETEDHLILDLAR
jgi:hypothetical protein